MCIRLKSKLNTRKSNWHHIMLNYNIFIEEYVLSIKKLHGHVEIWQDHRLKIHTIGRASKRNLQSEQESHFFQICEDTFLMFGSLIKIIPQTQFHIVDMKFSLGYDFNQTVLNVWFSTRTCQVWTWKTVNNYVLYNEMMAFLVTMQMWVMINNQNSEV